MPGEIKSEASSVGAPGSFRLFERLPFGCPGVNGLEGAPDTWEPEEPLYYDQGVILVKPCVGSLLFFQAAEEDLHLLDGLKVTGDAAHLDPAPVRGLGFLGPPGPLEGAAEAAVGGGVIGLQSDRLLELAYRLLRLAGLEVRDGQSQAHDRIVRHQVGHFLELGDLLLGGHTG